MALLVVGGQVFGSPSGTTWTERPQGAVGPGVTWFPDAMVGLGASFFAVAADVPRDVFRSSDGGSTWQAVHRLPDTADTTLTDIAVGAGCLVVVDGERLATSQGGSVWQEQQFVGRSLIRVRFIHGRWFILTSSATDFGLLTSVDGVTWDYVQLEVGGYSSYTGMWSVAWDGSRYLFAGMAGSTYSSTDGHAWVRNADAGLPAGNKYWAFARGKTVLIGASYGGTGAGNGTIYATQDSGATWVSANNSWSRFASIPSKSVFTASGVLPMALGWLAYDWVNRLVQWSSDGLSWTTMTLPTASLAFPNEVTLAQVSDGGDVFMQHSNSKRLYRFNGVTWAEVLRPLWRLDVIAGTSAVASTVKAGSGAGATRFHEGGRHGL